jgi:hypothetical protein
MDTILRSKTLLVNWNVPYLRTLLLSLLFLTSSQAPSQAIPISLQSLASSSQDNTTFLANLSGQGSTLDIDGALNEINFDPSKTGLTQPGMTLGLRNFQLTGACAVPSSNAVGMSYVGGRYSFSDRDSFSVINYRISQPTGINENAGFMGNPEGTQYSWERLINPSLHFILSLQTNEPHHDGWGIRSNQLSLRLFF